MKVTRWIFFQEYPDSIWSAFIVGAAQQAYESGAHGELSHKIKELSVHVSTKFNILNRIYRQMSINSKNVIKILSDCEKLPDFEHTKQKTGYVFPLDNDLKYDLIADIETFIIETHTCWELIRKFFIILHHHVGNYLAYDNITNEINRIHSAKRKNLTWISLLDEYRNHFIHDAGVYIAADISSKNQNDWELLILKSNTHDLNNQKDYFHFSKLNEIYKGFNYTSAILKDYLITLFKGH